VKAKTECRVCGAEERIERRDYKWEESGLKNVILKDVEVVVCPNCGESPVLARLSDLMRIVAMAIIAKPYDLTGDDVRFLRKFLGLTQDAFSEILKVDKTTLSKWENGSYELGAQSDRLIRLVALGMGDGLRAKADEIIKRFTEIKAAPARKRVKVVVSLDREVEYQVAA
jgi:putative zinc finger/helix-turn-helix YgiT family protein